MHRRSCAFLPTLRVWLLRLPNDYFLRLGVLRLQHLILLRSLPSFLKILFYYWLFAFQIIIQRVSLKIFRGHHYLLIQRIVILMIYAFICLLVETKPLSSRCLLSRVSHLHRLQQAIAIDFLDRRFTLAPWIITVFVRPHHLKLLDDF